MYDSEYRKMHSSRTRCPANQPNWSVFAKARTLSWRGRLALGGGAIFDGDIDAGESKVVEVMRAQKRIDFG
jgi:hypothetical protein